MNLLKRAAEAVESRGVLLVFPIDNRREPPSIWFCLHPRSEMRWEWDENGDDRVSNLWHLREQLSRSKKVIYTKWFRGRATFFSRDVFVAMLARMGSTALPKEALGTEARRILEILKTDSPLSTKELKRATGLKGRAQEAAYNRALKELWSRLLIVGYGEVDDGAFPSLAIGSTEALFEDLWTRAAAMPNDEAMRILREKLPAGSLFLHQFEKALRALPAPRAVKRAEKAEPRREAEAPKAPRSISFEALESGRPWRS
jgi:hypothetical protein